jgi:hypothetical protein
MPSLEVCMECESLLGEVIVAINAHVAEVRTMSTIADNGPHAQFARVRKRVKEASSAAREAIEVYQGHLREHCR